MKEILPFPNTSSKPHTPRTLSAIKGREDNDKETGDWLPRTLVIENRTFVDTERDGGVVGTFLGCITNKKVMGLILIYAFIATGLWTWFFTRPFGFGNRHAQVEDLKEQVDILDGEIDELEGQVGRLGSEVRVFFLDRCPKHFISI